MSLEEETNENHSYDLNGDILFHNVSIGLTKKTILSNLNFAIKRGEKVAIFGENGSGKSTLAKAILGFYPIQGNIYLNYHNTKQLDKSNIREYIDFVSGEADLFGGTVLENIELGSRITEKRIIKASQEAEIYQDIKRFEEGYQTVIGEKGVKLSGGQKQRILITRALIRNKPVIIFDNAFSKLDNNTSNKIFQNLKNNYPETTMIFITHKLEIGEYVDNIIKLEEGTSKI